MRAPRMSTQISRAVAGSQVGPSPSSARSGTATSKVCALIGRPSLSLIAKPGRRQASRIAGSDPFAVEDLVRRMKYGDYGRAGEIVMSGIACVETACWDIKGKALGVPVWQLLGGRVTDKVKAYANGWYTVERTPEAFHAA